MSYIGILLWDAQTGSTNHGSIQIHSVDVMNPQAYNFDPSGVPYDASAYYGGGDGYQDAEGVMYGDPTTYDGGGGYEQQDWAEDLATTTDPGSYYLLPQQLVVGSSDRIGATGPAVAALAFDKEYKAIYAATVSHQQAKHGGSGRHRSKRNAAMSVFNDEGILYSSIASHPEALASTLNAIYDSLYGTQSSSVGRPDQRPPAHAYQAPYGKSDPALSDIASGIQNMQLSVTSAVPGDGFVTTASPAGVRVHATGGNCIADYASLAALAATDHPSSRSLVIAAGLELGPDNGLLNPDSNGSTIQSLDLWNGLRQITSKKINATVTSLAACSQRNCVVAGCTDGTLRLIDDRSRNLAEIKSHIGGVINVAVSDQLVATTGYGSVPKSRLQQTPMFAYPDPAILVNDVRYLGRGGFPHPFAGGSGPRYLEFVPSVNDQQHRLLVASGQPGNGCQILVPFESSETAFFVPPFNRGEATTSLAVDKDQLAIGTNHGRILKYKMAGVESSQQASTHSSEFSGYQGKAQYTSSNYWQKHMQQNTVIQRKKSLEIPPFAPKPPAISIDATILLNDGPGGRRGDTASLRSIFGAYILNSDPIVSAMGESRYNSTFGLWRADPLLVQSKEQVLTTTLAKANDHDVQYGLRTVSTSELDLHLLESKEKKSKATTRQEPPNPNKLVYTSDLHKIVYEQSFNRPKRNTRRSRRRPKGNTASEDDDDDDRISFPSRYRMVLRPTHKLAASFNHSDYNQTDTVPGYDYAMTMPNAFVPPVLMTLYFIPEFREAALRSQQEWYRDGSLTIEMGYLFHRIDGIARRALLFPAEEGVTRLSALDAWAPSSFISCLTAMPDAERFQILDGSPAAIDLPRRPEAFYRFLLYQLDNELEKGRSSSLIGSLCAAEFVAINQFISGSVPPTNSTTKQFTVELFYDHFYGLKFQGRASFGDVLQFNLARPTRLRAWNTSSKAYETIVQRKIITSLPVILSIAANCAGKKPEEGLSLWQSEERWLPEEIEVELEEDGSVVVKELCRDGSWKTCQGDGILPNSISAVVAENTRSGIIRRIRYRLVSVVSLIRDEMDRQCPEEALEAAEEDGRLGHHVVHARVPRSFRKRSLQQQRSELKKYMSMEKKEHVTEYTVLGRGCSETTLQKRLASVESILDSFDDEAESEWVLVNGFNVSKTDIRDAQDFLEANFREPSMVVYRAIEESTPKSKVKLEANLDVKVPIDVLRARTSLGRPGKPQPVIVPSCQDLVAFDAEFVAVADEESVLTVTGSKVVVRETRHAVARISLILDGQHVVVDDHIIPLEPVTDYLTRFSGIVPDDLNPKRTSHSLIPSKAGYLKLRALVERGVVFVGHGLLQDFWTSNLAVPSYQIIDTVDIYHKPAQRYISLRFLTNFVLKRDMQQDVHDSVEDALAAYELYQKAVELTARGEFEQLLDDLYEFGQKTDWKLGVDDDM